jgi:hypothetical protein
MRELLDMVADNRNDTVEYWRSRAITVELKIREFAEQLERLKAEPPAKEQL